MVKKNRIDSRNIAVNRGNEGANRSDFTLQELYWRAGDVNPPVFTSEPPFASLCSFLPSIFCKLLLKIYLPCSRIAGWDVVVAIKRQIRIIYAFFRGPPCFLRKTFYIILYIIKVVENLQGRFNKIIGKQSP